MTCHHAHHCTACESIFTYCALNRVCMHSFPTDTTMPLSRVYNHLPTTATNHYFRLSCIHLQSFVKKASSPFRHCCCCCMPSETYGSNEVTQIFRSFPRTVSSTTGGWSRWNILMCFYISFWALRSHFLEDTILLLGLLFFIFCTFPYFLGKYTLHVCYVFNGFFWW